MRTIGKYGLIWIRVRAEWIKQNPPNHQGYYVCHICKRWVHINEMELDHVKSRSRYPHLRFVLSNLLPSHHDCNQEKGSTEIVNSMETEDGFPQAEREIF